MEKGICLGQVLQDGGNALDVSDDDFAKLDACHPTWVRFSIGLCQHADWDGAIIGLYQQLITSFTQGGRNMKIIGQLIHDIVPHAHAEPVDAADTAAWNFNPTAAHNDFTDQFTARARTIVDSLAGVTVWEIWNEPNNDSGNSSTNTAISASLFAGLLTAVSTVIKNVSPDSIVISGGVFGRLHQNDLAIVSSGADYLASAIGFLPHPPGTPGSPIDGVGQHIYLDQGGRMDPGRMQLFLDLIQGAAPDADVYITEVGWAAIPTVLHNPPPSTVIPQVQADNLTALYDECRKPEHARLRAVCWFKLKDSPGNNYGLLDSSGVAKPAFHSYAAVP